MFNCKVTKGVLTKTVDMRNMQPLQMGKIVTEDTPYYGRIVMRTASTSKFEVMLITPEAGQDQCWTDIDDNVHKVQLLPSGTELTITIK